MEVQISLNRLQINHSHRSHLRRILQFVFFHHFAGALDDSCNARLDFKKNVILAKIEKAEFPIMVRPGDKMVIEAWIDEIKPEGCWTHSQITVDGKIAATAAIIFVHLEDALPESFVFTDSFINLLQTSGVI